MSEYRMLSLSTGGKVRVGIKHPNGNTSNITLDYSYEQVMGKTLKELLDEAVAQSKDSC